MLHEIGLIGEIRLEQYRQGQLIRKLVNHNKIVWQAKMDILDSFFGGDALWPAFYMGLLKDPGALFTSNEPSIATLYGKEFKTYDETTRAPISFENADKTTDGTYIFVRNSTSNYCEFTISAGVTDQDLEGIYVVDGEYNTVQPTRLWCTAAFGNNDASPAAVTVNASDVLRVQYTIRIPKA